MAVSISGPLYPDEADFRLITPTVEILNPRNAENLTKIINHQYEQMDLYGDGMTLDFKHIKIVTNIAARMICKSIYGRDLISIKNANQAVYSSLEWAADYLYRKGELDRIPWQISELVY